MSLQRPISDGALVHIPVAPAAKSETKRARPQYQKRPGRQSFTQPQKNGRPSESVGQKSLSVSEQLGPIQHTDQVFLRYVRNGTIQLVSPIYEDITRPLEFMRTCALTAMELSIQSVMEDMPISNYNVSCVIRVIDQLLAQKPHLVSKPPSQRKIVMGRDN